MTTQEAYNKIKRYFGKPGAQISVAQMPDDDGGTFPMCVYRGEAPGGRTLKCAVGCLIPDELYDPAMENISAGGLFGPNSIDPEKKQKLKELFSGVDIRFLCEAQSAHDTRSGIMGGVDHFLASLDGIAEVYGLKVQSPPSGSVG